jgi:hypothetical protein
LFCSLSHGGGREPPPRPDPRARSPVEVKSSRHSFGRRQLHALARLGRVSREKLKKLHAPDIPAENIPAITLYAELLKYPQKDH